MDNKSQSDCSKFSLTFSINKRAKYRLYEVADIENLPKETVLTKMIMSYVPTPAPKIPGEFKSIRITNIQGMNKVNPYAIVVSVQWNKLIGPPVKIYRQFRAKKISPGEFKRKYIERLLLPDAQEEIINLRRLCESHDIYITSFEILEENSARQIFIEFVNGGSAIWK